MRDRLIFAGQLLFTLLVAAFLVVPAVLSISAGVTANYFRGLQSGVTLQWVAQVWELYAGTIFLSFLIAFATLLATLVIGVPAAYALHVRGGRLSRLIEEVITLPLAIPGLAIALALLLTYGGFSGFRRSWLFILAGHFVGLLTPASVYHHLISTENKQLLAMVSGGFFGVLCFIGLSGLILRRLTDARVRATGNASDLMILLVLYAQLILGLSTIVASTHHMDGSVMVMLADWAQAIVTLRPLAAAEAIAPVGLVYKLHVGLGLTLFVLFPFTRLVHIVSAPVWYLGRRYQIVRQKRPA